ncbi:hypothetical protein MSL71_27620 [Desulfoluna butyratoxydans]|uniref:Uncharacterized protein n=1 Tax=Desulfoluna butyratoxydans TaxID=231438 RepID=A0A4U8YM52_9BACT|nr:hypothetical protein MSL71_27620 [Desulfoluna butyratoxydans]
MSWEIVVDQAAPVKHNALKPNGGRGLFGHAPLLFALKEDPPFVLTALTSAPSACLKNRIHENTGR